MTTLNQAIHRHDRDKFSHEDADLIALCVESEVVTGVVVIDLSRCRETTTAALAELVLLRRRLLQRGSDLELTGLSGRIRNLYDICRLSSVLPAR